MEKTLAKTLANVVSGWLNDGQVKNSKAIEVLDHLDRSMAVAVMALLSSDDIAELSRRRAAALMYTKGTANIKLVSALDGAVIGVFSGTLSERDTSRCLDEFVLNMDHGKMWFHVTQIVDQLGNELVVQVG